LKKIDAAIIGAGPAGMAAAVWLKEKGIDNFILFERNNRLGGILNQCIHSGFGIDYYNEELTGPQYAVRMQQRLLDLNINYMLGANVIDLNRNKELTVSSSKNGIEVYKAGSVIITTGCRERTRENLEIPGTRPAGVFTAGSAQELINILNYKIGNKVIIQGSGDIGLIMARRLSIEGYEVVKLFERLPYLSGLIRNKVQCLDDFNIPIQFNTQISGISGKDRVEGVYTKESGKDKFYKCDTVLFSVGLIPEVEIGKKAGIILSNNFNPDVNSKFETNIKGIFIAGNSLHIHDLADNASIEGEKVADYVFDYLDNEKKFRKNIENIAPYNSHEIDEKYNDDFFKNLKDGMVCIVCPKGCIINKNNFGCKRGEVFFKKEKMHKLRRLTTTVFCEYNGVIKRIPVISGEEINIKEISKIKEKLKNIKKIDSKSFSINHNKKEIVFYTV